ncbi:MAG TPA: MarR family transcriptional regulator [Kiloniellaceae bacterium]|nr:MarR family transcriptional regulator [Kiloniellaceae bacterium]
MERVEDCIGFLVGKAAQQVAKRSRERLAPFDVTPTQYAVLKVLWDEDGQSGAELGARLRMDSATITGVVDRLEAAGRLERRDDGSDRRIQRLFLTAQGQSLREPLDQAMAQLNSEARSLLGADAAALWSALRHLGDSKSW